MLKQIDLSEAPGKTVKAVAGGDWDECLVISFEDGTFVCVHADVDGDAVPCIEGYDVEGHKPIALRLFGVRLREAGVITSDEFAEAQAMQKRNIEDRERAEYQRLKAKFEGKP